MEIQRLISTDQLRDMTSESEDDVRELMDDYELDQAEAQEVLDLRDELGVDDDDAYEIWQAM